MRVDWRMADFHLAIIRKRRDGRHTSKKGERMKSEPFEYGRKKAKNWNPLGKGGTLFELVKIRTLRSLGHAENISGKETGTAQKTRNKFYGKLGSEDSRAEKKRICKESMTTPHTNQKKPEQDIKKRLAPGIHFLKKGKMRGTDEEEEPSEKQYLHEVNLITEEYERRKGLKTSLWENGKHESGEGGGGNDGGELTWVCNLSSPFGKLHFHWETVTSSGMATRKRGDWGLVGRSG